MCGIVGFVGKGDRENLLDMMETIHHRGPDDEGVYIDRSVHLGHKRLSIIDLSEQGHQPMSNEDDTIWLVFNGEIYNFQDLRRSLIQKGHQFKSNTDSEVIIHLYEEYYSAMFEKLNGMFAFALLDKKRQKLYLARDKMGQKPLYYSFVHNTFIFASEARAILHHPLTDRQLSLKSVAKYLFYEHVPTPDCIWEDIFQLNPASCLTFDIEKKQYSINKYWKIKFSPKLVLSEEDYVHNLEEMLLKSIDRHLIADVPVGVYLSGGMDSSTVAYYAQKILNGRLKTFTIAFKEDTFDEQKKARQTADRLGSEHHEIDFDANDFFDTTIEAVRKMDAPFSDSSYIPAYYLNKYARNTIKVALGGEGGDEIFIGYPIYRAHELVKYLLAIPKSLRQKVVYPIINNVKVSYNNETWVYRLKKFIEAEEFLDNPFYTQQVWLGAFGPAYLNQLFKNEYHPAIGLDSLFDNIDLYREDREGNESLIDGLVRQTQHKYLMDDGLTKTDRASMAHSLEMRAPLLDGELVEWVNRLPFNNKFMNGQTKIVLRKLMKGKIPDGILNGRKQGFTPPIAEWFVNNLQKSIKDYLFSEDEFFVKSYIDRLWNEHVSGRQNHRKLLWTLFVWKLWSEKNLK